MTAEWLKFWNGYRSSDAKSESDLYFQVGKTIDKQPIDRGVFEAMIRAIGLRLQLSIDDHMLDMCCGNGLVTYELAPSVRKVTAVDFAPHLIAAAKQFKAHPHIDYLVGDVVGALDALTADAPGKYLMNDALAYFDPSSFAAILDGITSVRRGLGFRLLVTGIPSDELKWNFYDTDARKARYLENERSNPGVNDGIGRWWARDEIEQVCRERGLTVQVEAQAPDVSRYRMDAVIVSD